MKRLAFILSPLALLLAYKAKAQDPQSGMTPDPKAGGQCGYFDPNEKSGVHWGACPGKTADPKWVPQCWCGLSGDNIQEVGEGIWKCSDRHVFSEPWEAKNDNPSSE